MRAAALVAFIAGVVLLLLNPPSLGGLGDLVVLVVGAAAIVLATAWLTVALIGKEMPEPEFRRLVDRSDALASLPPPDQPPSEFDELVMQALDDLPERFRELLEHTPVTVSSRGHEHHAYGQYIGGTIARDIYPDRIVIYQDTLERDFGHDRDAAAGAGRAHRAPRVGSPPGLGRARGARPRPLSRRPRLLTATFRLSVRTVRSRSRALETAASPRRGRSHVGELLAGLGDLLAAAAIPLRLARPAIGASR